MATALRGLAMRAAGARSLARAARPVAAASVAPARAMGSWQDAEKTALLDLHQELGGKMVEFAGYALPVQFPAGVLKEHLHTREEGKAGLFDVSHMGQIAWSGKDAAAFLERVTVADLSALPENASTLSVITNEKGGIIDDTIISNWGDGKFGMVVNGACKYGDMDHFKAQMADFGGDVHMEYFHESQLLALQGPGAAAALQKHVDADLSGMGFMTGAQIKVGGIDCGVSRCGYTGEDGFELSCAWGDAVPLAQLLLADSNVQPTALGARDSLRLEAGLCLYGHDLDETISPIEAALNWTISKRRREEGGFLGAATIQAQLQKGGIDRKRVGFKLAGRAPAREHTTIMSEDGETEIGVVTSGTFSPTLQESICMGYVAKGHFKLGTTVQMKIRNKLHEATVVKMPFFPSRYYKP